MTGPPISFFDITVWMAYIAVILLLTTEVVAYVGASQGFIIDKVKIKLVAVAAGILFLAMLALRVAHILP